MWKCKKCGKEIKMEMTGDVCCHLAKINKDGLAYITEEDIELNYWIYECSGCGVRTKTKIQQIAVWEEGECYGTRNCKSNKKIINRSINK